MKHLAFLVAIADMIVFFRDQNNLAAFIGAGFLFTWAYIFDMRDTLKEELKNEKSNV